MSVLVLRNQFTNSRVFLVMGIIAMFTLFMLAECAHQIEVRKDFARRYNLTPTSSEYGSVAIPPRPHFQHSFHTLAKEVLFNIELS